MQKHANFVTIQKQENTSIALELIKTDSGHVSVMAYRVDDNESWICLGTFKNGEFVLNVVDSDLMKALNLQCGPYGGIQTRPPNSSD